MIAVIFEVWPSEGNKQAYLDIAAKLRPHLEMVDGFISVERFQSLTDPAKMLSLSFFRDESAIDAGATSTRTAVRRRGDEAGSLPTIACAWRA